MLAAVITNKIDQINSTLVGIPEKTFLVLLLGILLLVCHSLNFKFLVNRATIYLSLMLPVTVLLITQAISTNFYLSLGLIGALSIVRYRTPVKSQYELAYLFALIGIGVISGVNPGYAVLLTVLLSVLPFGFRIASIIFPPLRNENLNFNSSGKIELNLLLKIDDADAVKSTVQKGRLTRVDMNYEKNQAFYLFTFDSLADAESFKKALPVKPTSLSISNS